MTESTIQQSIRRLSRGAIRLFRQNVARAWVGTAIKGPRQSISLGPGDVLIRNARPLRAGLREGSSDLIGWRTVTITPDMVGQRVAVFAAVEVKSETGRPTREQVQFLDVVRDAGGFAGIARSVADAREILGVPDETD